MNNEDATKWIVVAIMVLVGLVSLVIARQLIAPLDRFVTEQACAAHGDLLSRPVVEVERSNRFGLINRSHGWCQLGPVQLEDEENDRARLIPPPSIDNADPTVEPLAGSAADPEADVQISIQEINPGGLYETAKLMGIVLQLGAASLAVRVVGEPILDRFVRSRR